LRIECFDVSNLQGSDVVASMVVFEDGLPRKSEYRRFAVRTVNGQDDVASLREVLTRRFRRYVEERRKTGELEEPIDPQTGRPRAFAYPPNLVVVDGGVPQVRAAADALRQLGIEEIGVCGLAKRLEELWLPDRADPVVLPRTSEALYLLQRIRDEAHRFAIDYHRQRRSRSLTTGALDAVPGLGRTRQQALLRHFGSVKRLRAATPEEIARVPGIGPRTAAAVHQARASGAPAPAVDTTTGELLDGAGAVS
jgi:excinuclease ABC subunit C